MGAPSVPPGRYFRMHLVGYFEGIDSERGLEWRCSDSLSLREFLRLENRERVPDHSWLSRTRTRLPHEVHTAIFDWVLALIAEAGLVKGDRIGVDASTMEANAALRNIVRRDTGEGYRGMLERLAQESGIETPTAEDLARLDRKRKGKKLSNQDWVSRSDPEAKIAKMKDGTTHLAYKPEHAVDLDTGAVVAAELHPADEGDTTTLPKTLAAAQENLASVDAAPTAEDPAECVTDKGYHSRAVLKALDNGPWKTRIAEPKAKGFARWRGDEAARRAVTNNRTRLLSGVAKEAFKLRAEIVERSFAHNLDRGGMRRTWLRGRENVHKRYLLHVAGHNLSLLMRQLNTEDWKQNQLFNPHPDAISRDGVSMACPPKVLSAYCTAIPERIIICNEKLVGNICAAKVWNVEKRGIKCALLVPSALADFKSRDSMNNMTPLWLRTVETASPSNPIPCQSPGIP